MEQDEDKALLPEGIVRHSSGLLYSERSGAAPEQIEWGGRLYRRFHDFIYLDRPTEHLTRDETIAVCRLRSERLQVGGSEPNNLVRAIAKGIVDHVRPDTLLEVGPGSRPLYKAGELNGRYLLADTDATVVEELSRLGYEALCFGPDDVLAIAEASIDIAVAVFVFQFALSGSQVAELVRMLSPNGSIVANVYRRTARSRSLLRSAFGEPWMSRRIDL